MVEDSLGNQATRPPALAGLRVADFSWVYAGPICTKYLAIMGAEVIKVETRRRPDSFRVRGSPVDADGQPVYFNRGMNFNSVNHGKMSINLDLTKPKAIEIAKDLIRISDIVIENFAFGVMERMGLGYSVLREINPRIIMLSSSGLGRTGPERKIVAYGNNLHAYCGLTSLVGYEDGRPRGAGGTWSDPLTGITAAYALMAALHYRQRTGQGQFIDLSMTEATLAQMPEAVLDYTMNQKVRTPVGNRDDMYAPHNCYPCAGNDKWVAIAVENDEQWRTLCQVIGRPELAEDERYTDGISRWLNQEELDPIIAEWTRSHDHFEAMEILQAAGVPAGASLNTIELINNPQIRDRGLYVEHDHPEVGKKLGYVLPWQVEPPTELKFTRPPLFGEHTDHVFLKILKLRPEEVQSLKDELVIY